MDSNLQKQMSGMGIKAHIKVSREDPNPHAAAQGHGSCFQMWSQLMFTTDLNLFILQLLNNNCQQIYREDPKDTDEY